MSIISGTVPGVSRLAGLQVELPRQARQRLKWFDYYNSRGHNARLTFRHVSAIFSLFRYWSCGVGKAYNSMLGGIMYKSELTYTLLRAIRVGVNIKKLPIPLLK